MNATSAPWNRNRLTTLLGIDYPIVQGPLGGFESQRLTAAVSNRGCLGSFGAHSLSPAAIGDVIAEIRELTSKPFAINLWVSMEDEGARSAGEDDFARCLAPLIPHFSALDAPLPSYTPYRPMRFEDQARALIDTKAPVFSFIYGIPAAEILAECRSNGIVTIGTATTPDEAIALAAAGVDAIAASGFEGGGHRGSFLGPAEDSLIGTLSLVPRVVDAVDVPVIAAGGVGDARGAIAALALGAEAIQIGTAFLTCEGSGAGVLHREALLAKHAAHTGLTRGFTGRLARGIRNRLMDELNRPGTPQLPYPLQRALIKTLSAPARSARNAGLVPMWAGQSASISTPTDATAFLDELIEAMSPIAGAVTQWSRRSRDRSGRSASRT